jgi:hypothetical protein
VPKPEKLHIAIDYGVTAHIGVDDDGICTMKFQDLNSGTFEIELHEPTGAILIAEGLTAWANWVKQKQSN